MLRLIMDRLAPSRSYSLFVCKLAPAGLQPIKAAKPPALTKYKAFPYRMGTGKGQNTMANATDAQADSTLTSRATVLLQQIDNGEIATPKTLENNLAALSGELGETQLGQIILRALETYGSSAISGKTAPADKVKEAKRKKERERCLTLLQLNSLLDDLNDSIEDMHEMFEGFAKQRKAETAAAQSLVQTTTESTNNIIHAVTNIEEQGYKPPPVLKIKTEEAKVCNAKMKTCSTNLRISDRKISDLEKEIIRKVEKGEPYEHLIEQLTTIVQEREGTKNELIKQSETYLSIGNEIIDEINKHLEKPNLPQEEIELYTEFGTIMNTEMQRVQAELDAFKTTASQALSPKKKIQKITETVKKISAIQETLESFKKHPSLSPEDRQKIEQLQNDYTENIKGLQEQQETLERLQQIEEQSKEASRLIDAAKSQYSDRESFIVAQYGGSWNFHAVLNGWDDYFSEKPEEKHVTTKSGDVVFHNDGNYYYYPGNDLNAPPEAITDLLEITDIQIQAYSGNPAKPFGNETRYGSDAFDFITRSTAINKATATSFAHKIDPRSTEQGNTADTSTSTKLSHQFNVTNHPPLAEPDTTLPLFKPTGMGK